MLCKKPRIPKEYLLVDDQKKKPATRIWSVFVWVIVILGFFVFGAIFSGLASAEDYRIPTNGISLNDAESGELLFENESQRYAPAFHLQTNIDVEISGMIAHVSYRQKFKNDSQQWQEAVYVFPLSEEAAVNHMEMIIGERRVIGKIKEREEAKRIYSDAKKSGKKAALTEQQRPNLFTQRVANIAPGEEIAVELRFVQKVGYDHGLFNFHLPTTLTPRYISGSTIESFEEQKNYDLQSSGWGAATDEVPDARDITPPMLENTAGAVINPMQLSIRLNAGLPLANISSLYHKITQNIVDDRGQDTYELSLTDGKVSMDRDFRLTWEPSASDAPEVAVFTELVAGENYLMFMLVPPYQQAEKANTSNSIPREMVFIIDTSSSMAGGSIAQAKQSLKMALSRMSPNDRFNLIEFSNNHRTLFRQPVPATAANLKKATQFVERLNANGGTNMRPALEAALKGFPPENYLKQILFITDGAVGNESDLFRLIESRLGDARLFTVGIGSAPNSYFMKKSAQFGRGSFTYIGDLSEVQERMSALFRKLESPALSDLDIRWPKGMSGLEQYPARTPDLYVGEPLVVAAKMSDVKGEIKVSGRTGDRPWQRSLSLHSSAQANSKGVSSLWGRAKIAALMDEKTQGRDPDEVREEVLKVALPLKLLSQYTSFVAVEEKPIRPAAEKLRHSAIPNAVAKGQMLQPGTGVQPSTYPRSATWMPVNLAIGSFCMLLLVALRSRKRWPFANNLFNNR